MKFRAYALGAVMAAALTGLVPATAMAAGTPTSGTDAGSGANSSSASNSNSNSNSDNKTNVNVSVVAQLPDGYAWKDKTLTDHGKDVVLPKGDVYRDGGVLGADDKFYFAPSGAHDGVVIAPMQCKGGKYDYNKPTSSGNWLGSIVDAALKACAGVYDAAYGVISTAFGGGSDSGYGSSC
jgi:hypothetical protein